MSVESGLIDNNLHCVLRAAGKPVQLIEAPNYTHSAICESLGHPYAPAGRAALAMMNLTPA